MQFQTKAPTLPPNIFHHAAMLIGRAVQAVVKGGEQTGKYD